jgi:hypothetical protein
MVVSTRVQDSHTSSGTPKSRRNTWGYNHDEKRERESMTTSAEENARETLKPVVDFTILRPCWVMSKSI